MYNKELKPLIIDKLKPLQADKIILFGSYAYGIPNKDSDLDLFLIRDDLKIEDIRSYKLELQKIFFYPKKIFIMNKYSNPNYSLLLKSEIKKVLDFTEILFKKVCKILNIDTQELINEQ